jgi:hypothetical protein
MSPSARLRVDEGSVAQQEDRLPAGQRTRNRGALPRVRPRGRRLSLPPGAQPRAEPPPGPPHAPAGARGRQRWRRRGDTGRGMGRFRAWRSDSRQGPRWWGSRRCTWTGLPARNGPCGPMEPATAQAGRVEVEVPPAIWGPWPARASSCLSPCVTGPLSSYFRCPSAPLRARSGAKAPHLAPTHAPDECMSQAKFFVS